LPPIRVADLDDPRLALYRGVRDPELLRTHGAFVAEGRLVVERLLEQSQYRARSVLVTPAAYASLAGALAAAECPVYLAESSVVQALTGFNIHRGCLAVGQRRPPRQLADLASTSGPILCLESVADPDNIGAAFRNAAAFGASAVVLSPGCSDPLYRKSIRTSMGATLTIPFAIAEPWPDALGRLRDQRWNVLALTPAEDAVDIRTLAAPLLDSQERRIALLLGHEGAGLSAAAQAIASARTRIPMAPGVDSLNVATAAAIGLYELTAGRSRESAPECPR
jgi:tRNA G18 (ribose-2'-O)-methylase SpoU